MIITKTSRKLQMHPHLTSLSTVGQSAGTVWKHSWYFVRGEKKKGNEMSEEIKLHDEEDKNKLH